ncbi:outer membrane porin, OprD family [Pseudomonas sp. G11-1]|uniref:OprD family porin n=1 Tax=Halopseudomonas bauzanensis TaxID=653930 RepID=A0A4U0YP32_9GAMM|nr:MULTISPECIES: OprD family porin [Halopseudomonas]MCO5786458.1 outer membrane porin, OprD family [Pseudomonas sp. G11-1]MCO5789684.1 outer membrane porin, OprD family [Pseudomonas sp. G11-2]EZQ18558.1 porin [Halopseudomonas bauzanensis]TKA92369.1 OprD family porin [Halopseudomonas bauzanensis]WGK62622.1 OprD family porin [Halopseudomonas sp. SMJS2]
MRKTLIASSVAAAVLALPTLSIAQTQNNGFSFVDDAKATLGLRNLYFNGDYREGDGYSKDEEWGQGFMLDFQSGYTQGPIGFGLDVFARSGIRLDSGSRTSKADRSRNPGTMFPLDHDDSAVSEFSQIDFAAKAKVSETELKIGRGLQPSLPVLTRNDGRLLPQTYSGATLTSKEIDNLTLRIGQMDEASGRNSTSHEGLLLGGGSERVNKFQYAGGDAQLGDNLVASYYFAKLKDYYKQHYLGAVHTLDLGAGQLITDLRYFDSGSTGANDSGEAGYAARGVYNDGEVDNRAMSAMFTYKLSNHGLGLGYQKMSGDSDFAYLNNGGGATAYLITDSQINKFERAGEKTWVGQYSYNFADLVPGLKFSAKYLRGSDFDVAPGEGDKEWERNLRLDYTVQQGFLKDLGVSLRHASLRSDADRDQDQVRVYLTYNFVLL